LLTSAGYSRGDGSDDVWQAFMAIQESDIKIGTVYETAGFQLRKVLRLMPLHVLYEIRSPQPPFYRVSVLKRKFAAEATRVHGAAD